MRAMHGFLSRDGADPAKLRSVAATNCGSTRACRRRASRLRRPRRALGPQRVHLYLLRQVGAPRSAARGARRGRRQRSQVYHGYIAGPREVHARWRAPARKGARWRAAGRAARSARSLCEGRPRGGRQPVDGATIWAIRRVCPAGRAVALRAPVSEAVWCGCLSHRRRRCGRRLSGLGRRTRCGQSGRRGCCGRRPRCGRQLADSSGQVPQVASGRAMTVLAFRGCGPGMPRGSSRPWATSSSAADRPTPGGRPRRAVPPLSAGCRIGRTARTAPWPAARGGRVRTPIVTTRQVAQRLHVAIPPRRLQPAATDDKKRLAWRRLVSTITSAPTANWSILA
jgi:hypothetical protein